MLSTLGHNPHERRTMRQLMAAARRGAGTLFTPDLSEGALQPGRFVVSRLLLIVAITVAYAGRSPDGRLAWWGSAVLLLVTAAEPNLCRLQPRVDAVQLPGLRVPRGVWLGRALAVVAPAVLVLLAACALWGVDPRWFLVLAGGQLAVAGLLGVAGLLAYAGRARQAEQLRTSLEAYAPQFLVYTTRSGGLYQLRMWLPYLERLGRPFVVLTRERAALAPLRGVTDVPIVARDSWRELDDVVVPSLRAAFYVNSVAANADLVTYRQLTHVYLGHGESDKSLSSHPAHAMYDLIFVAGQAAIGRYERNGVSIPAQKFVVVGRPQGESFEHAKQRIGSVAEPTILYAPTWAGYNQTSSYSSLRRGPEIVAALLRRPGPVIFRPHPFSRERVAERVWVERVEKMLAHDASATGRAHRWNEGGGFEKSANSADAMVADLSSVLTEFLHSDKPMAVIATGEVQRFRDEHPVTEAAYVIAPDLSDLDAVLDELVGADSLASTRATVRRDYLGDEDQRGESGGDFAHAVLRLLDER
jgi:hypothetical protein